MNEESMITDQEKLGTFLKSERDKRGLTVEDMATSLKITPASIRCIERGDTEAIGLGDIFVKSYVKSYLLELGHSPDDTLQRFSVFENTERTKLNQLGSSTMFFNIYLQVGALILFIIFLFIGVKMMDSSNKSVTKDVVEVKVEKEIDIKKDNKFSKYSEEEN